MTIVKILAAAIVAAVLGTAGVSVAGAVSGGSGSVKAATTTAPTGTPPAPATSGGAGPQLGRGRLRRTALRQGLALAAKTIGISTADLVQQLSAGTSIADVATAHGVQPQTVVNALVEAATDKINAAENAGRITATQATKLEQNLTARVTKLVDAKRGAQRLAGNNLRKIVRGAGKLAAQTIGITPAELAQDVRGGLTIAQVATAHGVQPQTVITALVDAANTKIQAAENANRITAAQATRLEQRVATRAANFVDNPHPKKG